MTADIIARDLLKIQAVFFRPDEPFTWASGIKSPVYCDNRLTLTAPAVRTDVETGRPVYKQLEKATPLAYDWIRASASMPLASKVVELEGMKVLDGGVADSIPLAWFESIGYNRNVVILTQPEGYVKEHNRLMPLMRIALRHYPRMIEALDKRHLMYNEELSYVRRAEREGRCLVIRPEEKLPIGHISHDPDEMRRVYDIGRIAGQKHLDAIRNFLSQEENHL